MATNISRFFKKLFAVKNRNVAVTKFLLLSLLITTVVSFSLPAFSFDAAPSDPQEAIIKNILKKSGEKFGWDQSYYFVEKYSDGRTEIIRPIVWGPRQMSDLKNGEWVDSPGAGYGFEVIISYGEGGEITGPFRIMAYPTVEIANRYLNEGIASAKLFLNTLKLLNFTGIKQLFLLTQYWIGP